MTLTTPNHATPQDTIDPINWNTIGDQVDKDVWDRLTSNFWLPEKVLVSNDIPAWKLMDEAEHWATMQVFTGLTMLDTMQGTVGALSLMPDATTPHEEAVYTNIAFMESVHAKSYSNIFMTLADTPTINQAFNWGRQNERLQYKAHRVLDFYKQGNANMRKAASTLLESFLFYSGFYLPLRMAAHSKLTNTADIIRLIIRDEAVHGYYIGYKYQQAVKHLTEEQQAELQGEVVDLLLDLMDNEEHYTRELYDPLGWTEDVLAFLRYNANKALNNLGYDAIYPSDMCQFNPAVMTSLNPGADENHDFFSGSGSHTSSEPLRTPPTRTGRGSRERHQPPALPRIQQRGTTHRHCRTRRLQSRQRYQIQRPRRPQRQPPTRPPQSPLLPPTRNTTRRKQTMTTQLRQYWPLMYRVDKTIIILLGATALLCLALLIAQPSFDALGGTLSTTGIWLLTVQLNIRTVENRLLRLSLATLLEEEA